MPLATIPGFVDGNPGTIIFESHKQASFGDANDTPVWLDDGSTADRIYVYSPNITNANTTFASANSHTSDG